LIGNKIDKKLERKITLEEAKSLANQYNMDYYEVSAKTDEGIDQAMGDLTELCLTII
jgi:hypothetical protein